MEILSLIATDANLRVTSLLQSLATELPEAGHSGFGINLDILETNVINLAIIIGALVYFGRGFLGKTLSERRSQIEIAINEAEKRKQNAAAALAEQQQKLAQAKTEAARIRAAAEESAEAARLSILAEAEQDVERLKSTAAQDVASQQERVIRELRQRVVTLAIQKAEARLKGGLSGDAQKQLVDRSIALIGGNS